MHGVIFTSFRDYLLAAHYGEHAEMGERTCMLRGDPACTLEVTFSDGSPSV